MSLRAMPNEPAAPNGARFARGIWEGDQLPTLTFDGDSIAEFFHLMLLVGGSCGTVRGKLRLGEQRNHSADRLRRIFLQEVTHAGQRHHRPGRPQAPEAGHGELRGDGPIRLTVNA